MKYDINSELGFFAALAKSGSLSAAARALDITPPAVTKRLAQLEQRLGARLVNRTTRTFSLTPEGELYLSNALHILDEIRELEDRIASSRSAPKGLLRVNATLGFGRTVVAPVVSDFARQYPDVEVQLQLTDRPLNLVEEAFDLGIRFGELPDTRLTARRIMSNRRFLYAAPAYLKRFGEPQTPQDLAQHHCIVHRQNDETAGLWRLTKGRKTETVKVSGALSSNDGDVVLNWALDGHGILLRSEWDAAKYVQSGRLNIVLPEYKPPAADLYAYYPTRRNLSSRVRAFVDFLAAAIPANGA